MRQQRTRSRTSLGAILLALIVIPAAILTLLSVSPVPLLPDLTRLSDGLLQVASVVGAVAVIIGVLNLLAVHLGKLTKPEISSIYSIIIVLTFAAVLIIHFLELRGVVKVNLPASSNVGEPTITLTLMDVLQVVIESALSGLLFFFLVYAAYRMMRRRVTIWGVIFMVTLVIVLIGYAMPTGTILSGLREWILKVPVSAGTRGLLIGIALGTITVGVRVLIGQDRFFRE